MSSAIAVGVKPQISYDKLKEVFDQVLDMLSKATSKDDICNMDLYDALDSFGFSVSEYSCDCECVLEDISVFDFTRTVSVLKDEFLNSGLVVIDYEDDLQLKACYFLIYHSEKIHGDVIFTIETIDC